MKYDLHIHSKYSYDSLLSPYQILKSAKKQGLDGIAVTDHNTILGGQVTRRENQDPDLEVIIGAEIKTEYGDIIGLFLNTEIVSRKFYEVIDEIKVQGGYSVLAHPYRLNTSPEKIVGCVDCIEIFNARSSHAKNKKADELTKQYSKGITAGSDAHSPGAIGRGVCILKSGPFNPESRSALYEGKETNYFLSHGISYTSEIVKKIGEQFKKTHWKG
jgi:predicted metal-dependent phosphoesterase TrpH